MTCRLGLGGACPGCLNRRLQSGQVRVSLAIIADEEDPHAILRARDASDEMPAEIRFDAGFKLKRSSASAWIEGGAIANRPRPDLNQG